MPPVLTWRTTLVLSFFTFPLALAFSLVPYRSTGGQEQAPRPTPTPTPAAASSWTMDRGDLAASGFTPIKLEESLAEKWTYDAGQGIETAVVLSGDRLFAADVDGGVHAVHVATGERLWYTKIPSGFLAPPSASGELVIVCDYDGMVHALDASTGTSRWTFPTSGEIDAGATILGDRVLISSQDGNLYAVKIADGQSLWTYATGDQVRCRPAVAENRTFLGGCDGQLHRVQVENGQPAGEPIKLDGPTGSTVAIVGDQAYLPTQSGAVLAFNWKTGQSLWTYTPTDRPQEFRSSAAATSTHVVVANKNRQVLSLDPQSGALQWSVTLPRRSDASPVIAADDVWVTATDGRIYRFALDDGTERWQYELRGSILAPPTIIESALIVATNEGKIICFGPTVQGTLDRDTDRF